jgi:putative transposase
MPSSSTSILRGYRTELDPTVAQRLALAQCAGTARWVYNWAAAEWERQYTAGGKPSWITLQKQVTQLKREPNCAWLRDSTSYVVRDAIRDLGKAYDRFFRNLQAGVPPGQAGKPRFRRRNEPAGRGFRIGQPDAVQVRSDAVRIAGIGWIRLKEKSYIPLEANYRGLSCREIAGRW